MDIDLEDLDGPSKAPAKAGKFAPKNSKFRPVAKPKLEPGPPVLPPESTPAFVPKAERDDPPAPLVGSASAKPETEQPSEVIASAANGNVTMDTDMQETEVESEEQEHDQEDKVVREIDVFFTPSIDANSQLYVLQYPLRPSWRPYELDEHCEKVKVKPGSAEVEVEMSVQVDSANFDPDADDYKTMKKQVLSSRWKPTTATGYAVGVLMGNKLYINPVHAVVQLRPSLQHLKSPKKMNTTSDEDMIDSIDIKNEKVIKQSKKQNKLPGAANEQTQDNREWVPLKYHGETSEFSSIYRRKMATQDSTQIQFSMSPSDYIDSLCPATASDKVRTNGLSISSLQKLPLEERYKTRLLEGPSVHRYSLLKHLAPEVSDEDVIQILQTHAQLVQGLWVAKSKLKYGQARGKDVLLRDYVLLQFSKNPLFPEVQMPKSTLLSKPMKEILEEFAVRRDSCRDWKFREPTDESFIKKYPDVVEEQKQIRDRALPQITELLFPKTSKHGIGDRRATANTTNDVAPRTTNAPPSKTVLSDETREALPRALQKLFQTYKVCSFNKIRQRLGDIAVLGNTLRKESREARAAEAAASAPQEELLAIINQVAVNIHGDYVLKSSPDHPQYDGLRKIVIDLLLAEGPKGKLKKAAIFAAAKMQLKRDVTSIEYQKVLNELCISQNSAWVLRSGDGNPTGNPTT